jgi:hypothetical protein
MQIERPAATGGNLALRGRDGVFDADPRILQVGRAYLLEDLLRPL